MSKPEEHYRRAVYFESGDEDLRKTNTDADLEVNTKGVLGYPKIFRIIPNQPLTAPYDTMQHLERRHKRSARVFIRQKGLSI